jgi:hypothetical protein
MESISYGEQLNKHERTTASALIAASSQSPFGVNQVLQSNVRESIEAQYPFYRAHPSRTDIFEDSCDGELILVDEIGLYRRLLTFHDDVRRMYNRLYEPGSGNLLFEQSIRAVISADQLDPIVEGSISRIAAAFALYHFGKWLRLDSFIAISWSNVFAAFLREEAKSGQMLNYQDISGLVWMDPKIWQPKLRVFFRAEAAAFNQMRDQIYPKATV